MSETLPLNSSIWFLIRRILQSNIGPWKRNPEIGLADLPKPAQRDRNASQIKLPKDNPPVLKPKRQWSASVHAA